MSFSVYLPKPPRRDLDECIRRCNEKWDCLAAAIAACWRVSWLTPFDNFRRPAGSTFWSPYDRPTFGHTFDTRP